MSAEIIDIKAKRPNPGNGAREALIESIHVPPWTADWLLMELWARGFKVVPLSPEDQA